MKEVFDITMLSVVSLILYNHWDQWCRAEHDVQSGYEMNGLS